MYNGYSMLIEMRRCLWEGSGLMAFFQKLLKFVWRNWGKAQNACVRIPVSDRDLNLVSPSFCTIPPIWNYCQSAVDLFGCRV
jgi:hypothetical protein